MEAKMRRVGLAAAVAFAFVATAQCAPARADPFESYNPDFVNDCVAGAAADEAALHACFKQALWPLAEEYGLWPFS